MEAGFSGARQCHQNETQGVLEGVLGVMAVVVEIQRMRIKVPSSMQTRWVSMTLVFQEHYSRSRGCVYSVQ